MLDPATMIWLLPVTGGFATGVGLGLIYFLGLWATIRQLAQRQHTGLWMMTSLVLRLGLVLTGFYFLMGTAGWQGLLAALLGFSLVRLILTRWLRPISRANGKQT
ncbi:MAG: ATP synthase subunit I [Thermodesulfobacteriota bacterium]|nr:ATP synthase subunit I [Thermodesulfobacteriota bacterium]